MTIDSDKILHDLLNSLDSLEGIRPGEIPNIALYMDQVTTFMDAQLASSRRFESDKVLTKTMINNYAKNKLLPPPVKKKYSPEHMMLLVFIYYFKNILSITDIQTLLAPITDRYFGTESGFSIKDIYDEIFQMEKEEIASVKEDLLKKADVSKSMFGSSPEEDREFLQLFSFICLLSFDVYLKKQMIEHMVMNWHPSRRLLIRKRKIKNKRVKSKKTAALESHRLLILHIFFLFHPFKHHLISVVSIA